MKLLLSVLFSVLSISQAAQSAQVVCDGVGKKEPFKLLLNDEIRLYVLDATTGLPKDHGVRFHKWTSVSTDTQVFGYLPANVLFHLFHYVKIEIKDGVNLSTVSFGRDVIKGLKVKTEWAAPYQITCK